MGWDAFQAGGQARALDHISHATGCYDGALLGLWGPS
jgi:hypothetical protein